MIDDDHVDRPVVRLIPRIRCDPSDGRPRENGETTLIEDRAGEARGETRESSSNHLWNGLLGGITISDLGETDSGSVRYASDRSKAAEALDEVMRESSPSPTVTV